MTGTGETAIEAEAGADMEGRAEAGAGGEGIKGTVESEWRATEGRYAGGFAGRATEGRDAGGFAGTNTAA